MKKLKIFLFGLCFLTLFSCVEEIDFASNSETFESALVVEAVLTNEPKQQLIKLSRTYRFEEEGPNPEIQAQVSVLANGQTYEFTEIEHGTYLSNDTFVAQPNIDYQLKIITSNGRTYSSTNTQLTPSTQIDNLYIERITNEFGADGIGVFIDSFDPTNQSKFYRFEYEETFKIVAPFYKNDKLVVIGNTWPDCTAIVVPRDEDVSVCYKTDFSSEIIITSTANLQEDRIEGFQVRFVPKTDFIIAHRYSILVKQYVQEPEAFLYYSKLKEISNQSGSLFSQLQPGLLNGNISSNTNTKEPVIGYFEVSSVYNKRVFFSYADLFPNEELPPFVISCIPFAPSLTTEGLPPRCGELITSLENNAITYWDVNSAPEEGEGPYKVVPIVCGDCTVLGSTEVPDFWEE